MRKIFIERARRRSRTAYFLLSVALFVIVCTVGITIALVVGWSMDSNDYLFSDIPKKMEAEKARLAIESYTIGANNLKFKYTFLIILLLSSFFFISQTLLRLYRYNMLKADFYFACADSIILTQKFGSEEKEKFQQLLSTIISEKITLTTPATPNFSFSGSKDKSAG